MIRAPSFSPHRQWLRVLCTLLNDKNLELRRAATEATEALYLLVDASLVSSYASYATGPEAVSVPWGQAGWSGTRAWVMGGGGRGTLVQGGSRTPRPPGLGAA